MTDFFGFFAMIGGERRSFVWEAEKGEGAKQRKQS